MRAFGPFEHAPEIAVALSGGMDSMVLLALSLGWAKDRGGCVHALIVDHNLRSDSKAEARDVGVRARDLGAYPVILTWQHDGIVSAVQQRARQARYDLLEEHCRRNGLLHMFVGHHADDQVETQIMRAERQSGWRGRAGMSAVVERKHFRILRPLLSWSKARLRETGRQLGLVCVEDPSNRDLRFWRGKYRQSESGPGGSSRPDGAGRRKSELKLSRDLAAMLVCHPEGFLSWNERSLLDFAPGWQVELLKILVRTAGGGRHYPPIAGPIPDRLVQTIGGALLASKGNRRFALREPGRLSGCEDISAHSIGWWDRRFVVDNREASEPVHICRARSARRLEMLSDRCARPAAIVHAMPTAEPVGQMPKIYFGAESQLCAAAFVN